MTRQYTLQVKELIKKLDERQTHINERYLKAPEDLQTIIDTLRYLLTKEGE